MNHLQKDKIKKIYKNGEKRYISKHAIIGTVASLSLFYCLNLVSTTFFHYQLVSQVYIISATFFLPAIIYSAYKKNWNKIETSYLEIIDEEKNGPREKTSVDRILSDYE